MHLNIYLKVEKSREKDQVPISRYIAKNKIIQLTVLINLDHLKTYTVYLKTPDTSFGQSVYIFPSFTVTCTEAEY